MALAFVYYAVKEDPDDITDHRAQIAVFLVKTLKHMVIIYAITTVVALVADPLISAGMAIVAGAIVCLLQITISVAQHQKAPEYYDEEEEA